MTDPLFFSKRNFLAVARWQLACLSGLLAVVMPAVAQTKLKLSNLKPGTERVQLINNGDFQFQGLCLHYRIVRCDGLRRYTFAIP